MNRNSPKHHNRMEALKIQVLESAQAVKDHGEIVRRELMATHAMACVWRDPDLQRRPTSDRGWAAWALTETDYVSDDQQPQDTLCAPGVITANQTTIDAIEQLNAAREHFRAICAELKKAKIRIDGKDQQLVSRWLRTHGFARINRRQAYRQITVLNAPDIQRIAFSWCAPSRMKKLTPQQVRDLILSRISDDETVTRLLTELDHFPDPAFIQVRKAGPAQPRANVWFEHVKQPTMYTSPIPLVIASHHPTPDIKPPAPERQPPSRERAWDKINQTPWIAGLQLHRYRQTTSA